MILAPHIEESNIRILHSKNLKFSIRGFVSQKFALCDLKLIEIELNIPAHLIIL